MLCQRFDEGNTLLAGFLNSFLGSRKAQHIRMVLVKKLQEVIELESTQWLGEMHPGTPNTCLCSLTTAVVLPACCHPPFLLPFGLHVNTAHRLQHLPLCHDYNVSLRPRVHGRGPRWPTRPVRLPSLKVQKRRHQQAPQWSLILTQIQVFTSFKIVGKVDQALDLKRYSIFPRIGCVFTKRWSN